MPFTFLAHQAVVLPLKLARPRWLSGTALVLGSMAPDFEYFLRGDPYGPIGHTLAGQLLFCLPLTVVGVLVVRALAETVARELPDLGAFHLRDLALLGRAPLRVGPLVVAALVGSFSHVAWDGFTHETGWAVALLPALRAPVFTIAGRTVLVFKLLQHASTLLGAAVTLVLLREIGKRRLIARWSGADPALVAGLPPASGTRRVALAATALALGAVGAATALGLPDAPLRALVCAFLRATLGAVVGIALAAAALRVTVRPAARA